MSGEPNTKRVVQAPFSDQTKIGSYNWGTLKLFAMKEDFEKTARFVSSHINFVIALFRNN